MRVANRIVKLEERCQVGRDKDGQCRYCRGRERELGKVVVVHDPPLDAAMLKLVSGRPQPGPTPCPRCGRDLNVTVLVQRVDMIAKRRAEGG